MNPYMYFHKKPDYQNPDVMSISRLPAHSRWGAFASIEEAKQGKIGASSNVISLNGVYRFKLYNSPERAEEFFREDFDDSAFCDIAVPGNWEVQGHDLPVYTNTVYPWLDRTEKSYIRPQEQGEPEPNPPYIPSVNAHVP